jgi:phosphoglycolate phosphatase
MTESLAQHYRLIVFDWDGTLRDSVASIVDCGMAALADAGFDARFEGDDPEPADRIRSTIGLALADAVPIWAPGIEDAGVRTVLERYRFHWLDRFHAASSLFPGVPELLQELSAQGLLLAVATGKSRVGLERDLTQVTAVRPFFAATRTADESAVKPSPVMLLQLMEELGCRPQETLMIGDTTHDLLMALNAGVDAVGVLCGAMSRGELEPHSLALLDRTVELPKLLV